MSNGVFRRLGICIDAWVHQSTINHVTGDINFAAICLGSKPTVLTVHDCGFLNRPQGWRRDLLKLLWLDLPVKRASVVTTVSESVRGEILELTGCREEKVRVIPNAISEEFRRSDKVFNTHNPRILQIGTATNKNIPRLLEALEGVRCTLVIVGELNVECREKIDNARINMENYVNLPHDEIVQQYSYADVVAFASTYEGFGMPIVEANAIGRPVLTSNISSMPEVAGDAACLVDPFSVESIRSGLLRILTDEAYRKDLITKGYANAKRFNPDAIAEKYLQIYLELSNGCQATN